MGILSRIGKGALAVLGVGGGNGISAAKEIAEIVEKWAPSAEAKHDMQMDLENRFAQSQASARAHDSPLRSGIPLIDALVNGINRLIRPTVTIGLLGGLYGWWALPEPGLVDPMYWRYTEIVIVFWFGGRALFKDLPAAIKYIKSL